MADFSDEQCKSLSRYVNLPSVLAFLFTVAFTAVGDWPNPFSFLHFSISEPHRTTFSGDHSDQQRRRIYVSATTTSVNIGSLNKAGNRVQVNPL